MTTSDFTSSLLVDQTHKQAFDAIINLRGWWSEEIEGDTTKLNEELNYHYEDVHRCKLKLIELVLNEKIVWLIIDNYFKFTKDETEWKGTKLSFEISKQDSKTHIQFTHVGLTAHYECYEICRDAWTNYIQNSLYSLITTGEGMPNGKGKPRTENEKKLTSSVN